MAYQKKVLVLSDAKALGGTGIIKLTENGDATTASVHLHNAGEGEKQLYLAFGKDVLNFTLSGNSVISLGNRKLSSTLDCLITDGKKPRLFGSTSGDKYRCFNLLDEYERQNTKKADKLVCSENGVEISQKGEKASVENASPASLFGEKDKVIAENVESKPDKEDKNTSLFEEKTGTNEDNIEGACDEKTAVDEEEKTEIATKKDSSKIGAFDGGITYSGDNFYAAVKPQLDEMFICYPADNQLAELVPNSKWVRVSSEDDYYVVGLIFELDEPLYICYGIHGKYTVKPTDDLAEVSEWLPLDTSDAEGEGYWMIYQSASDGKTLKKD